MANLKDQLAAAEHQIILDALNQHHWHRGDTAESLGVTRVTLYNKMRRYRIQKRIAPSPQILSHSTIPQL